MSRTWKDLRPDQRETARRFSERRAVQRGRRREWPGEQYPVVLRETMRRRPGRRELAAGWSWRAGQGMRAAGFFASRGLRSPLS